MLQQLKNDLGNKELAARVSSMKQELASLQKRINLKIVTFDNKNIDIIRPYNQGTTQDIPLNSGVIADITADEIEKK